jgi:hypothetical protein
MNLMSGPYKLLYMPICRVYAKHLLKDKPPYPAIRWLWGLYFWIVHRYWPHFKNPRSFSEKVWNRMLFDRNPLWTMLSDKLLVRGYVASKVGSEYLIPLLWSGDNPEEIPFDKLPLKFVVKTNHGCGYNIIVKDKTQLDQRNTTLQLEKWLHENYCQEHLAGMEWSYKNIIPTIIVESFLEDSGSVPVDYKFFCFSGRVEFFKIDFGRFEDHSEKFFDRDLNPLDLFEKGLKQYQSKIILPENCEDMVRVAESLAVNLDFIRVDLYNVSSRIYFGELTCYPGGGIVQWIPRKYDFLLGEKWKTK